MNEKIKEFAQQVNVDIIEPEYAKIGGVSEVNFETYQDLEKFSELIIRECFSVMENLETDIKQQFPWMNNEVVCTSGHIKKLKEYFGVEE